MAADVLPTTEENASPADQLGAAGMVLGLISLATCWWFPYGAIVGTVGTGLGVAGWLAGRDGLRVLTGIALSACGAGASLLLAWDYWKRTLGL